jgi:hypothetical protein
MISFVICNVSETLPKDSSFQIEGLKKLNKVRKFVPETGNRVCRSRDLFRRIYEK